MINLTAMKIETREIYKCEFCNKLYQRKHSAEYHEKVCVKNPANDRPCYGCNKLTKKAAEVDGGNDRYGEQEYRTVDLFYCNAKKMFLHTPKNAIKGNVFDLGDDLNEPMPIECSSLDTSFIY
jgi:hypothetical protein